MRLQIFYSRRSHIDRFIQLLHRNFGGHLRQCGFVRKVLPLYFCARS